MGIPCAVSAEPVLGLCAMVAPGRGDLLIRVTLPFALAQDQKSFAIPCWVRRDLDKPNATFCQGEGAAFPLG